jgi:hypothetical protein
MKKQMTCKPVAPVFHPSANVSLKEQIAKRAYELWLYQGHKHGNDLADWHQHRAQASPASAHTSLRNERAPQTIVGS